MASKVYFCDFHTHGSESFLGKFSRLLKKAGIQDMELQNRFVAIKMHFGELGNLAFLRPNFARAVAELIKEKGGRPFLTDCNTLYPGSRKNALEHLDNAYINGFSPLSTGCHIIIADGIKGTDETLVPVDGKYVKEAKIGSAIASADVIVSLNHFKGHESTGFGGAIKNLGMGCGSRAGKMEMHYEGKPRVNERKCVACKSCTKSCAQNAIVVGDKARIDPEKCVGCGRCVGACLFDAITGHDSGDETLHYKIDEYAKAVLDGKQNFHINIVMDVSPYCDCYSTNDVPIVADIGVFASFDPVACDRASADACNAKGPAPDSIIANSSGDVFKATSESTDWRVGLDYAEEIGLGSQQYEIIKID